MRNLRRELIGRVDRLLATFSLRPHTHSRERERERERGRGRERERERERERVHASAHASISRTLIYTNVGKLPNR